MRYPNEQLDCEDMDGALKEKRGMSKDVSLTDKQLEELGFEKSLSFEEGNREWIHPEFDIKYVHYNRKYNPAFVHILRLTYWRGDTDGVKRERKEVKSRLNSVLFGE